MPMLYPLNEAVRLLGGISHWTLRKHVACGNVKVTRIGRRVFLDAEQLERIQRDGLPSLGQSRKPKSVPPIVGSEVLANGS